MQTYVFNAQRQFPPPVKIHSLLCGNLVVPLLLLAVPAVA